LLVQLGCAFSDQLLGLAALVPLRYQPLVVDPSPERLAPFASTPQLRVVAMDLLRFAAFPMQCDRILLEESLLGGEPSAPRAACWRSARRRRPRGPEASLPRGAGATGASPSLWRERASR
jgi:hypothetical protein